MTIMKGSGRTITKPHPPDGRERTVLWWRAARSRAVVLVVVAVSVAACGGSPSKGASRLTGDVVVAATGG